MVLFNMQKFGTPHDPQEVSVTVSQQELCISLLNPLQLWMRQQSQQPVPISVLFAKKLSLPLAGSLLQP
eukprot:6534874-Ditylum_brightwellii.AAC.1